MDNTEGRIEIPRPVERPLIRSDEVRGIKPASSSQAKKVQLKGTIKTKELGFKDKLKRSFVKEDLSTVRDYVVFDILIPVAQNAMFGLITGVAGKLLGVNVPKPTQFNFGSINKPTGYRDYTGYTTITRNSGVKTQIRRERYDKFRVRDITFTYKEDALAILELMTDIIDSGRPFTVFDFYDECRLESIGYENPYTNKQYGWRSVTGVEVAPITVNRDGELFQEYYIDLPDPRPV